SLMTLVSVTAYHSFGGEVEALNTPTIRRLTPSCRHQLPRIAPRMGLTIQSDKIVDDLQREYLPREFQNIQY
ncbi:MAG: hypothetical protein ACRECO_14160, partial [Xanthobacteraceae bacterium]